jgi:hypothetical protein
MAMKFDVYRFEIDRKKNRHGIFGKDFWAKVEDEESGLSGACGCYLFALQNGQNIVPWYVGKTEKRTFENECCGATQINYYNEVLVDHNGTPLLFLLPRMTGSGAKFSKPSKNGHRDIDFLETMLIGMALEENENLVNIKKTALLREMKVPDVINSGRARPTGDATDLRNALGLSKK